MNSDFKDLLRVLLKNQVKFLVVGGYAVMRYTEPRYTKDLDVLISPSVENARLTFDALREFGAPLSSLTIEDLTTPGNFFQIGLAPNRVDIIVTIPGVDFDSAFSRHENMHIDDLMVPVISIDDLIQAKLSAGRPQDLVDASALTKSKLR